MLSEETYQIHRTIIYCFVLFFEVFGLFGNINLVVLTIRKKSLRTKYGCILATLATIHTLCLLYELVDMSFSIAATFYSYKILRGVCFKAVFPYIFLNSMQTGTMWILSLDLLITIIFPLKSRHFNIPIYFSLLFFFPVVYGSTAIIFGYMYLDDETLPMCNPPSALHPIVQAQWYYFMMVFTILTVVFYTIALALIYYKAHRHNSDIRYVERKALKTLKYLIFLFVMFRFITITIASVLIAVGVDKEIVALVQNYNVLAQIVAYSQNAYVCYYRSSEYRLLLSEQISKIHPKLVNILPKLSGESSIEGQQWHLSGVSIITTKPFKPRLKSKSEQQNNLNDN
ncbi:CRE-SRSX-14 protein [Caenorhabditis remanei]|uniref:CRE-SRSX-14 protein n=1 Tax=Caenorhabditis remanei TaxID=31234 RepID=E3MQZ5_CAERE|nr:CRE-SRSX-14 protein [Caenorhabditis remanei]